MIRFILIFIAFEVSFHAFTQTNIPLHGSLHLKKQCLLSEYASEIKNIPLDAHTLHPEKPVSIDNTLISVLYYHEIADAYKNSGSEFSLSIKNLDEDSNPIIRIITLKLK
jgi:hypothetical protein